MSQNTSRRLRSLSSHEIFDLIRAGILLILTVALAVIIPPKVWGAESPAPAPLQIELSK